MKKKHNYYIQCQGVMAITGLKEIDFIVYTKKGCSTETIKFDEKMWNEVWLPKLTSFYFEFVAPRVFEAP